MEASYRILAHSQERLEQSKKYVEALNRQDE